MTPHFNRFPQRGCQSTVHKLRNPLIYLKFREFVSKKFWRGGPKKSKPPRWTTHPRPPRIGPIYISIDSSQSQDSEYTIFNGIDTWRPKVMLTGASCRTNIFSPDPNLCDCIWVLARRTYTHIYGLNEWSKATFHHWPLRPQTSKAPFWAIHTIVLYENCVPQWKGIPHMVWQHTMVR